MKRMCRQFLTPLWRRRLLAVTELLRHATIVTDRKKLACLNAEVEKRKRKTEGDRILLSRECGADTLVRRSRAAGHAPHPQGLPF